MGLNPELLEILACPRCKGPVEPTKDQKWLVCQPCGIKFEVRDDIPIMLLDEASPWEGE